MLFQAIVVAASAALASAQITYNSTTGQYICPANNPNGDFCAGESLVTNIIIRCTNGIGQPGNCNDNLAGYPPLGVNYAPCYQSSNTSGDAACSKNCQVICNSGGCGNGTITVPNCTPTYTASSSTVSSTASPSSSSSASSTTTSTGTTTYTSGSTTITETFTTTYCPASSTTLSTTYVLPTGTGSSSPPSNGTATTSPGSGSSPSKTPVGPTTTGPSSPGFTGAASSFSPAVGGTLAGIGLVVAYFL